VVKTAAIVESDIARGDVPCTFAEKGELRIKAEESDGARYIGEAFLIDSSDGTTTVTVQLVVNDVEADATPETTPTAHCCHAYESSTRAASRERIDIVVRFFAAMFSRIRITRRRDSRRTPPAEAARSLLYSGTEHNGCDERTHWQSRGKGIAKSQTVRGR
jgi:hypothetical protein